MENISFAIEEIDPTKIRHNSINNNLSDANLATRMHPKPITINRDLFFANDFYPRLLNKQDDCTEIGKFLSETSAPTSISDRLYHKSLGISPSKSKFNLRSFLCKIIIHLQAVIPILSWLPNYSFRELFLSDILAGLVLSTSHISDGIAFGWLTGLAPVHGLYLAIFPVLIYAILGQSRQVSIGTFPIVSIVCHHVLENIHADSLREVFIRNGTELIRSVPIQEKVNPIEVLTSLAFLVGLIQLLVGLLRIEMLFALLSDTILSAFLAGVSVHILMNQAFPLFGIDRSDSIPVPGGNEPAFPIFPCFKFFKSAMRFVARLQEINLTTASLALGTITVIFLCKVLVEPLLRRKCKWIKSIPLPIELIMIFTLTAICNFTNLKQETIPRLFTPVIELTFKLPQRNLLPNLILSAILISFVTYSHTYFLGKAYARKHNYRISGNQEMLALGMANLASSFLHCYPCSPSLIRTAVQDQVKQKTQLASIISAGLVWLFIRYALKHLQLMPVVVLSAIITVSVISIIRIKSGEMITLMRSSKLEASIWIATFVGILLLGVSYGLVFGIGTSVVFVLLRIALPKLNLKYQIANSECFLPPTNKSPRSILPNVLVFEIEGPLIYLNTENLKHKFNRDIIELIKLYRPRRKSSVFNVPTVSITLDTLKQISAIPTTRTESDQIESVVLDCSSVPYLDWKGVDLLLDFNSQLSQLNNSVRLLLANCNQNVLQTLNQNAFFDKFDSKRCFVSVYDAVMFSNMTNTSNYLM